MDGGRVNLGRFVVDSARRFPERVAVRWGERVTTYAELDRRTNALAHGLASLGVRKGDRVAVLMRNRPEMIETMFACFKAGYCLVPLNSRFTPGDISYHVDDAAAAAVVTDAEGSAVGGRAEVADRPTVVAGDAPDGHPDRPERESGGLGRLRRAGGRRRPVSGRRAHRS